MRIIRCSPDLL